MNGIQTYEKLEAIRKEFGAKLAEYQQSFEDALKDMLQYYDLYDVDVIDRKSGQKGRLKIYPNGYSTVGSEIRFVPYKKNGELSMNTKPIYLYLYKPDFEDSLKEMFEKA